MTSNRGVKYLQSTMCSLMQGEGGRKPFKSYHAKRTVLAHAMQSIQGANADMSDTKMLNEGTLLTIKAFRITQQDIAFIEQEHENNCKLLRKTAATLMLENKLSVYQASEEITQVLGTSAQKYKGTYQADLKAANVICIDTGDVFDKTSLNAINAMITLANVTPLEAFNKITTIFGLEIRNVPSTIKQLLDDVKTLSIRLLKSGLAINELKNEIMAINDGKKSKHSLGLSSFGFERADPFYLENMFSPQFKQGLLAEIPVTAKKSQEKLDSNMASLTANNKQKPQIKIPLNIAIQDAAQKRFLQEKYSTPLLVPGFLINASNHIADHSGAYLGGGSIVLLIAFCLRDQIKLINLLRPIRCVVGFFKAANKPDNETAILQTIKQQI